MDFKVCKCCKETKLVSEFYKDKRYPNSYSVLCTSCSKKSAVDLEIHRSTVEICCNKCNIIKPVSDFIKSKHNINGYEYRCKDCNKRVDIDLHLLTKEICCSKCKQIKTVDNYYLSKWVKNGYNIKCISCIKDIDKTVHEDIKELECKICKQVLSKKEFQKKPSNQLGYTTVCKVCYNKKNEELRSNITHKKCSKCKEVKEINQFTQSLTIKSGYTYSCTDCIKINKEAIPTVTEKSCTKCNQVKQSSEFYKNKTQKTGLSPHCKECVKKDQKEYKERDIKKYNEMVKAVGVRRRKKMKDEGSTYLRDYERNKRHTNIEYNILCNLRGRVYSALKYKRVVKSKRTLDLLGCTVEFLRQYLEERFLPTMTWENYGSKWHLDHVKSCNSFDLTDPDQQKLCFHYTNLQPLFAVTTIIDGVEYIGNMNKSDKDIDYIARPVYNN